MIRISTWMVRDIPSLLSDEGHSAPAAAGGRDRRISDIP